MAKAKLVHLSPVVGDVDTHKDLHGALGKTPILTICTGLSIFSMDNQHWCAYMLKQHTICCNNCALSTDHATPQPFSYPSLDS